jgi:hypothetical protein
VIGTLLAGPRLVLRAFDDLHQIALAARELPAVEQRLIARLDDAQQILEDARAGSTSRSPRPTSSTPPPPSSRSPPSRWPRRPSP